MGAGTNSSGNQENQSFVNGNSNNSSGNNGNNVNKNGGNNGNSGVLTGIKHNPGISTEWTSEEQAVLDDGLVKFASEINVVRYAKIASKLPNKTVRDIALRCRWLNKKEVSKRRKEDHSRKSKDKREKVTENTSKPAHAASRPGGHPYSVPAVPVDNDDGVSFEAIGGPTAELLKQNHQFFQQISSNFSSSYQVQDNIGLLCQARDNLSKIMSSMSDTPEIMKQMPPLPVKLNEELANTILPRMNHQMQS